MLQTRLLQAFLGEAAAGDRATSWWRLVRKTFSSGQLSAVVALVLFTLLAVSLRVAIRAHDDYFARIHGEYSTILAAEQEPRREEKNMGIVAAVLGSMNAARGTPTSRSEELASADEALLRLLATQFVARHLHAQAVEPATYVEYEHAGSSHWERSMGPAYTLEREGDPTRLLIPAPWVRVVDSARTPLTYGWSGDADSAHLAMSVERSVRPFERASQILAEADTVGRFEELSERKDWPLVHAYFISPTGVIRIWQAGAETGPTGFSPTKVWSAAAYFERLLRGQRAEDVQLSPAYVDYGGQGVVRTLAMRLQHDGKFLGVVAIDLRVPEADLLEPLRQSRFLSVHRVEVFLPSHAEDQLPIRLTDFAELKSGEGDLAWQPDHLVHALRSSGSDVKRWTHSFQVGPAGEQVYWVPLGSDRRDRGEVLTALALTLTPPGPPLDAILFLFLAGLLGALALATLIHGMVRRTDRLAHFQKLAVLRGLQVAVLEFSEDEHGNEEVSTGNGRAEELLQHELNKPGAEPNPMRLFRINSAVERLIVKRPGCAEYLEEAGEEDLEALVYETEGEGRSGRQVVRSERRDGLASSYYVRFLHRPQWYQVCGGPLLPAANERELRTFATLIEVRAPRSHLLTKIASEA